MAIAVYCNTTTDLALFCPEVEKYQNMELVEEWTMTTGQTLVYQKESTGQVNLVFENGSQMTEKTSIATVAATAKTFWYDSDLNILYIHCTGDADPNFNRIETGEDWDTLKTNMRNEASDFIDSVLSARYSVPLAPRAVQTHHTNLFDSVIRRCCALITGSFIAKRENPIDPFGIAWFKEAYNPDPLPDESKGLLDLIVEGTIVLQNQTSAREVGSWNVIAVGTNTATQYPILRGGYGGSTYKHWKFKISTGGAIGTAKWDCSFDGGTNYDLTLQDTYDADNDQRRFYVGSGVWVEWPTTTYAQNDTWTFEMIPFTDPAQVRRVSSSEVYR